VVLPSTSLIVGSANVTFKMAEREALVWATDLQSGQPLPNTAVKILRRLQPLASGKTDKDGLFAAKWENSIDTWRTTYAVVGEAGSDVFGLALSGWSDGIGPWTLTLTGVLFRSVQRLLYH